MPTIGRLARCQPCPGGSQERFQAEPLRRAGIASVGAVGTPPVSPQPSQPLPHYLRTWRGRAAGSLGLPLGFAPTQFLDPHRIQVEILAHLHRPSAAFDHDTPKAALEKMPRPLVPPAFPRADDSDWASARRREGAVATVRPTPPAIPENAPGRRLQGRWPDWRCHGSIGLCSHGTFSRATAVGTHVGA
jgi:hypothetical protein